LEWHEQRSLPGTFIDSPARNEIVGQKVGPKQKAIFRGKPLFDQIG
jgi:hypothetical protein